MPKMIHYIKLGDEAEGLDFPPAPGDLARRVFERLQGSLAAMAAPPNHAAQREPAQPDRPAARKYLQPQKEQYVFGNGADMPAGYTPPQ